MSLPPPSVRKISLEKKPAAQTVVAAPVSASNRFGDGLTLVLSRNYFYKENYSTLVRIFCLQLLSISLLAAIAMKLISFTSSRDYFFPVREDNALMVERPMSDPVYSDDEIVKWVEKAITQSLTFGFYDYQSRLQESRNFFTTQGFAKFLEAMDTADILDRISAGEGAGGQVILTLMKPSSVTRVVDEGLAGGFYVWKVEAAVGVNFIASEREHHENWKLEITVVRVPTIMGRYGIGIDKIIATSDK